MTKWLILSVFFVIVMAVVLLNPSYEKSIEAKYYYSVGDYQEAYTLSKEAFGLDPYNRMASTIMTQAQTALVFVDYIEQAKTYMNEIQAMADQKEISAAHRAKIKMMCEIMMDSYVKMSATVLTDKTLIEEASHYYQEFVKLHDKIVAAS